MRSYKIFLFVLLFTFLALEISFSYAMPPSVETGVKIFGGWRVSKFSFPGYPPRVSMNIHQTPYNIFTLTPIWENGTIRYQYQLTIQNNFGMIAGMEQQFQSRLQIGNSAYNVPSIMRCFGGDVTCYFAFPNNFVDMAKKSDFFTIQFPFAYQSAPISLSGFNAALKYALKLAK